MVEEVYKRKKYEAIRQSEGKYINLYIANMCKILERRKVYDYQFVLSQIGIIKGIYKSSEKKYKKSYKNKSYIVTSNILNSILNDIKLYKSNSIIKRKIYNLSNFINKRL